MADAQEADWGDPEEADWGEPVAAPAPKEPELPAHLPHEFGAGGELAYLARLPPDQRTKAMQKMWSDVSEPASDFALGLVRGATLEAAPAISRAASPDKYKDEATQTYTDAEERSPWAHGAGRVIGALPAALSVGGAGLAAGVLGGGALGTIQGFLGSNPEGVDPASEWTPSGVEKKLNDALAGGTYGAAVGAFLPSVSKAIGLKRAGIDKLTQWLGREPDAAANAGKRAADLADQAKEVAEATAPKQADNVVPIRPAPAPEQAGFNVGKASRADMDRMWAEARAKAARPGVEDTAAMKSLHPEIDAAGKGDMFAPDTVPNAGIQTGARGPDVAHKGAYRGQQFKFPQDRAGWEREPAAWKAGEDSSKPGDIMDLFLKDSEGPNTAAAMEAMNRNEAGASRARWGVGQDSRIAAPAQDAFAGPATGRGAGGEQNFSGNWGERPPPAPDSDTAITPINFDAVLDDVQRRAAAAGKPDMLADFGNPSARGAAQDQAGIAKGFPSPAGAPDEIFAANPNATKKLGAPPAQDPLTLVRDRPAASRPTPRNAAPDVAAAQVQVTRPWDQEAIDAARDRGRQKIANAGAWAGKQVGRALGGALGGSAGHALGGFGGGMALGPQGAELGGALGEKLGRKIFSPEKAAARMVADPSLLTQLEQQGGELGRAATFVMQGAKEGGEAGLKARAFVVAMMPQFRAYFAEQDDR